MFDKVFLKQTELVIRCLPLIERYPSFSLKGGTAINLFVRDMPRLSVDIDLTYVPFSDRETALDDIDLTLKNIAQAIKSHIPRTEVQNKTISQKVVRLSVYTDEAQIKIEPNLVLRGTVYPVEERELCQEAQNQFEMFVKASCLAEAELFAGKLCAALDRQHPRDLYDLLPIVEGNKFTPAIRQAFVVYLACHSRPINELLSPELKDIRKDFDRTFVGMQRESVNFERLRNVQEQLSKRLLENMTENDRQFLLSVKEGNPDWHVLGIPHLQKLPALKWKLLNIRKMNVKKHKEAIRRLRDVLEL